MKDNIVVLRSFIDSRYLSQEIKKKYTFQEIIFCKPLKFGGSNDIFLLSTAERKYIVKVFFKRQCWPYLKEHYLFELKFQEYLYGNNFSVPRPIKNIKGELIEHIILPEGSRFMAIYEHVSGIKWDHTLTKDKRLKKLGSTVAEFHKIASNFKLNSNCSRKLDTKLFLDKAWYDIDKYVELPTVKIKNDLHSIYLALKTRAEDCKLDQEQLNLIHGDVHAGNHLYNVHSKKITLIDFELCGYGHYAYELAVLKWDLLHSHKVDFIERCMNEFLEGYSTISTIAKNDIENINFFVKLRSFFMLGSSFLFYPDRPQLNSEYMLNYYISAIKKGD
jgi:Ser/Thr protein kinase RdoA (MazF antagonist)